MKRIVLACFVMAGSTPALASGLYVNGVRADGLRNTAFHNCDVRIDDQGNVHISAKGYVVQATGEPATTAAGVPAPAATGMPAPAATAPGGAQGGRPTRQYYLVGLAARPRESQWVIDVFINGKFVRKVTDRESQTMVEVTKYMNLGRNTVHVQASRKMERGRLSSSPRAYVEVVVGEGSRASGALLVSNPIVRYRKTAAELKDEVKDFVVVAQ